jgi:hypothetical protein
VIDDRRRDRQAAEQEQRSEKIHEWPPTSIGRSPAELPAPPHPLLQELEQRQLERLRPLKLMITYAQFLTRGLQCRPMRVELLHITAPCGRRGRCRACARIRHLRRARAFRGPRASSAGSTM